MPTHLCITVRFLLPTCHARGDRGEPEWPPSPLRVFQALVAAAAARWSERIRLEYAAPALRWLERQPGPTIVAAAGRAAEAKHRLYVPDNVGDRVAASWARGGAASLPDYRTEKDVRPTRLRDHFEAVHYLWPASGPEFERHGNVLIEAARSITHLGWGVDMVAGHAAVLAEADVGRLAGERWEPADDASGTGLRVPVAGTLDDLIAKHDAFLSRIGPEGFRPVAPLTAFRVVGYRRATDAAPRPFTAFSLLKPDARHATDCRSFDPARRGMAVAGMLRHAAAEAAKAAGWSEEKVATFVLGHGEPVGHPHVPVQGPRLTYLPLPSIEFRGGGVRVVTGIRRALIAPSQGGDAGELRRLAQLLSGSDLIPLGGDDVGSAPDHLACGRRWPDLTPDQPAAILSQILYPDPVVRCYTAPRATWATVTPVVLPGYDDPRKVRRRLSAESEGLSPEAGKRQDWLGKLDRRIDHLLRKAIRQAGYPDELARAAGIEWRGVGFWPGTEPATCYEFPAKLRRFRRLHVRLTWRAPNGEPVPLPGPLCLGGGRFCGLGLFAAIE